MVQEFKTPKVTANTLHETQKRFIKNKKEKEKCIMFKEEKNLPINFNVDSQYFSKSFIFF